MTAVFQGTSLSEEQTFQEEKEKVSGRFLIRSQRSQKALPSSSTSQGSHKLAQIYREGTWSLPLAGRGVNEFGAISENHRR